MEVGSEGCTRLPGGMGGEDGEEMAVDGSIFSYTMAIVITAIIVVSIVFEVVEERTLEGAKEWQRPVIAAMFSELTILGFIGLVMFTTTKIGKDALDRFVCDPEYGLFKHDEESCLNLVGVNTSTLHVPDEFLEQGYICLGGLQAHWFDELILKFQ